jgi:hypothetical protein
VGAIKIEETKGEQHEDQEAEPSINKQHRGDKQQRGDKQR